MTQSKKSTSKKKQNNSKASDISSYAPVGLIFLAGGAAFMASDNTRASAIPFLVLGITFLILSREQKTPKRKK